MSIDSDKVDLNTALATAKQAAELGRQVLLDFFGGLSKVGEKGQAGLVSEADLESEKVITAHLRKKFPDLDILGEESSFAKEQAHQVDKAAQSQARWIIDPLDGTTNYVHNFAIFCISIGLELDGEVVVGVIDVPIFDQIYHAVSGQGAFENDKPIMVSERSDLRSSLLATGFWGENPEGLDAQIATFGKLVAETRGVRRAGSAAFDLCMVAKGVFDGFWEQSLKPWDTAAGALLVKEAGGKVTNFSGESFHPNMNSIIATNNRIHDKLQKVVAG